METITIHTPFSLPIPNILCQKFCMRKLTATLCLTIAVEKVKELKSSGMGASAIAREMAIDRTSVYRVLRS
jgi:hypothetical protein